MTDDEIADRVAYVKEFEALLHQVAADALSENNMIAGLQVNALYSAQERVQAAWAGADLGMPIEEAVALLLIFGAMAEASKERSFLTRLTRSQSDQERTHAALGAYARDVLLAGRQPSHANIFERFTEHYTALLQEGGPIDLGDKR